MTDEENKMESGHDDIMPPIGSSGSGNTKWIAIIIVLVVVIAGLAVAYAIKPSNTVSTSGLNEATGAVNAISGTSFNFQIGAGNLQTLNASYGDGSGGIFNQNSTNTFTVNINGVPYTVATLSHNYTNIGSYLIYFTGNTTNGGTIGNNLLPMPAKVNVPLTSTQAGGFAQILSHYSTNTTSNAQIFEGAHANVALAFGFFTEPTNSTYAVFGQSYAVYKGVKQFIHTTPLNYKFNASACSYQLSNKNATVNLTDLSQGYYIVQINTETGIVNATTGVVSSPTSTVTYLDFAIFANGNYHVASPAQATASGTFLNAEYEAGGFRTLDPALAYDTVSGEILANVYQTLTTYQGSNSSAYAPNLALRLPNLTNGGVNNNYHNYTQTVNSAIAGYSAPSYAVKIAPGENYTFYINNNSEFQNGTAVTAWDVMYSFTRTLLFTADPGAPGWIIAQYILPGNYYASMSFWNITQNMTVDNATNSITIHFQHPMPEALVYQIFFASGTYVTSATWLQQQGAGITWNAAGFSSYISEGLAANWNTKVQFSVDANGPYKIFSESQNSQVVLEANPHFTSPNKWVLAPSIKFVDIEYISSSSTTYLLLSNGQAQAAGIPSSSWNLVQGLEKSGTVYAIGNPTLSLFWYNFNANVNITMAQQTVVNINMPSNLFVSLHARKAFAYAYNETQYLNTDVGNALYNTTFGQAYAGMLPQGMLGYQSISQLNNLTQGVPYFNLKMARADWNITMSKDGAALGLSMSGGNVMYNGKNLVIPLEIYQPDAVDFAGATSWGAYLAKVIPGASFPVVQLPFPTLLGNQVQNSNPMPVYLLGWAPDYPFPTDYLGPMALPVNASTYPGPNDFTPWWFGHNASDSLASSATGQSQAANLTEMINWYDLGAQSPSTTTALTYFHKMNEMLVNMTFYVYIVQSYSWTVLSSKVNKQQAAEYQLNTMWVGAYFMYNDFTYAPTS